MSFHKLEFRCPFLIHKGKMEYGRSDFSGKFNEFKTENSGKRGEVIFKIEEETVEYWQHKWYRGFLVPPIARECFDNDVYRAHIELKKMFLIREVSRYLEIPSKYRSRCIPLFKAHIDYETGEIKEQIYAFLPSTADLTYEEMKEYILNVEKFISEFVQTGFGKDAVAYRNLAFGVDPEWGLVFDETT